MFVEVKKNRESKQLNRTPLEVDKSVSLSSKSTISVRVQILYTVDILLWYAFYDRLPLNLSSNRVKCCPRSNKYNYRWALISIPVFWDFSEISLVRSRWSVATDKLNKTEDLK